MRVAVTLLMIFFVSVGMSNSSENIVDQLMKDFAGGDTPGAAVMVIRDGKPVLSKSYGMADLAKKTRCTSDTNFRLASVTKQFTAMSILILAERKQLSLDDSLLNFAPEFPEYGRKITLRHLLSHTSGIPDYEDHLPSGLKIPLSDRDVIHILCQQTNTYFEPGTDFRYSNSGYACLAKVVEVVSGETFPAFLEKNIFVPIGMSNSIAYVAGLSRVPNRALGYAQENGQWTLSDQSLTSAVLGDGGVYSSIEDLFKWDQALSSGRLVSRGLLDEAFTARSKKSDFASSGYGYGFYVGEQNGTKTIWHYGSTCGFRTHYVRYPEKQLSVILLTNRRDTDLEPIASKMAALYW